MTSVEYARTYHHAKEQAAWDLGQVLVMVNLDDAKRPDPYTKIVEELPQMRSEAVQLVRQAVGAGRRAYVLVNNRAEGNVPLTVEGLVGMLQEEIFDGSRLGAFRWLADIWLSGGWSFPRFW